MWPKMLRKWLDRRDLVAQQHQAEEVRAKHEQAERALKAANILPLLIPPPC